MCETVQVRGYKVSMHVPAKKVTLVGRKFKNMSCFDMEQELGKLARKENDPVKSRGYEFCQSTLKWADSCNGKLVGYINSLTSEGSSGITFEFSFDDYDDLNAFIKDYDINVGSFFVSH